MALSEYRWKLTWNVALNSLTYPELELMPYNNRLILLPQSQKVNQFPTTYEMESGELDGGGRRSFIWKWDAMTIASLDYLLDTYFGSGATLSVKMTVNQRDFTTRDPQTDTYTRYNCYSQLPRFTAGGMKYKMGLVTDIQIVHVIDAESS